MGSKDRPLQQLTGLTRNTDLREEGLFRAPSGGVPEPVEHGDARVLAGAELVEKVRASVGAATHVGVGVDVGSAGYCWQMAKRAKRGGRGDGRMTKEKNRVCTEFTNATKDCRGGGGSRCPARGALASREALDLQLVEIEIETHEMGGRELRRGGTVNATTAHGLSTQSRQGCHRTHNTRARGARRCKLRTHHFSASRGS